MKMYFAVLWKNQDFSLEEIMLLEIKNLKKIWNIIFFDTDNYSKIYLIWWIIKYWKVITYEEIWSLIENKIVWVNDYSIWNLLKNNYWAKKYKIIENSKTDLEIKNKWVEIMKLSDNLIWLVDWYQNIALYEEIDFNKPVSWMNIWMMPSKLVHIMLNIWIFNWNLINKEINVYDPFVWFWTTWFVANYFWYNFIWSDLNITQAKKNLSWRSNIDCSKSSSKFTLFKHDVNVPFNKGFLKNVNLIVSEWWLGPVVNSRTKNDALLNNQNKILEFYINFFENVFSFWDNINIVITIPRYLKLENNLIISNWIKEYLNNQNINYKFVNTVYSRKWQNVWRELLIITK